MFVNLSPRAKRENEGVLVNLPARAKREICEIFVNLSLRAKREAQGILVNQSRRRSERPKESSLAYQFERWLEDSWSIYFSGRSERFKKFLQNYFRQIHYVNLYYRGHPRFGSRLG